MTIPERSGTKTRPEGLIDLGNRSCRREPRQSAGTAIGLGNPHSPGSLREGEGRGYAPPSKLVSLDRGAVPVLVHHRAAVCTERGRRVPLARSGLKKRGRKKKTSTAPMQGPAPQPMYHNHHIRPTQRETSAPRSRRGRPLGPGLCGFPRTRPLKLSEKSRRRLRRSPTGRRKFLFGPFCPPGAGQVHAWSDAQSTFRTVS